MCYKHTMLELFYFPANNFCHIAALKATSVVARKGFLFK